MTSIYMEGIGLLINHEIPFQVYTKWNGWNTDHPKQSRWFRLMESIDGVMYHFETSCDSMFVIVRDEESKQRLMEFLNQDPYEMGIE